MNSLMPSDRGPGLLIGSGVSLAEDVGIGPNVVLHDLVIVGTRARLEHGAVLGRPAPRSRSSRGATSPAADTLIGADAIVCPYAVIDAGARIGAHAFVGNHSTIRGGAEIEADASIGALCVINSGVRLGEGARMQSHCGIGPGVLIEADVFLGPAVRILTGRTMSGPERPAPPVLRRGCQIGTGARILQGVEIGEDAVVGAGAVVTTDVLPGAMVRGVPARVASSPDLGGGG